MPTWKWRRITITLVLIQVLLWCLNQIGDLAISYFKSNTQAWPQKSPLCALWEKYLYFLWKQFRFNTNSFALNLWYKRIYHKETSKQKKEAFLYLHSENQTPFSYLLVNSVSKDMKVWQKQSTPNGYLHIHVCVCVSFLLGKDKLRITNNLFMTCVS